MAPDTGYQTAFLTRIRAAIPIAQAKGAVLNTTAVIAQAAHESAWGTSQLAVRACNLFGVKATPSQIKAGTVVAMPTREFINGQWVRETDYWTVYPSWNECLVAYADLIRNLPWFHHALAHADLPIGDGDALGWLKALEEPGQPDWATDPAYVHNVASLFPSVRS